MSHVQEVGGVVRATARQRTLRQWLADGWAAIILRWSRAPGDPRNPAVLRQKYIDFIRQMLEQQDDGLDHSGVLNRLEALDWEELQALYWDCERVAAAPEVSRGDSGHTPARDALWDLTPLLK